MANGKHPGESDPDIITLGVLSAIEEDERATQRAISEELGIALGLANAYLKRCVKKGFVKVRHIPANRYAYYLTPTGFAEKSRLTADYLSMSFNFFRSSREQCAELFDVCEEKRWTRVALAGCGDLAEIATLCQREGSGVEIIGIVNTAGDTNPPERFAGLPVVDRLTDLDKVRAVIVTDIVNAQKVYDRLSKAIPPERILTAPLLKVSREMPRLVDD
jgi:DNA-binding MarR family transcriptional regulator